MNSFDWLADRRGQFLGELDYITIRGKSSACQEIDKIPLDIEKKLVSNLQLNRLISACHENDI